MKRAFKQVVPFFNHLVSRLDVTDLGRWKLPLRIFFLLGIVLAVVEAGRWISGGSDRSSQAERSDGYDRGEPRRLAGGMRVSVAGCVRIARWSSFTDEKSGQYISSPSLMHDPTSGYVFLVYDITVNEGTFRAYYTPKGEEASFPVRWSDREVRAFRILLNEG